MFSEGGKEIMGGGGEGQEEGEKEKVEIEQAGLSEGVEVPVEGRGSFNATDP